MDLTLPWPPSNNTYKRHFCTKKVNARGDHIVSAYLTDAAKAFKEEAGQIARYSGMQLSEGQIALEIDAYCPKQNTDLDNLPKAVQDALNNIAWADDKQIARLVVNRKSDTKNPRLEVSITEISGAAIVE